MPAGLCCSLTLAGNPICTAASYRGLVLAQLRRLQFLDHARVTPSELRTALELHQVQRGHHWLGSHNGLYLAMLDRRLLDC